MHLTDIELAQYVDRNLDGSIRAQADDHLADCLDCVERLAALYRLPKTEDAVPLQIDGVTLERARRMVRGNKHDTDGLLASFFRPYRWALGGLALVAVGLTVYMFQMPEEPSRFRAPERAAGAMTLSPEDGSRIRVAETDFRWSAVAHTIAYRFVLLEEDGRVLWTTIVTDTAVKIPPSVALLDGTRYLWRVEALFPDDTRLRAPSHAFIVSK